MKDPVLVMNASPKRKTNEQRLLMYLEHNKYLDTYIIYASSSSTSKDHNIPMFSTQNKNMRENNIYTRRSEAYIGIKNVDASAKGHGPSPSPLFLFTVTL